MSEGNNPAPVMYKGVMVSSTFTDLKDHRGALIKAIDGQPFKAVAMENDGAKPDLNVLDSSLQMVRDAAAYIGVISHKYGQIPESSDRNPGRLSLTELEFDEAQRLERPILIFIMGDDHDVKPGGVETNPERMEKLKYFREKVKRMKSDSALHRVYKVFNSVSEFEVAATQSVAALRHYLDGLDAPQIQVPLEPEPSKSDPIPKAPAFYAEPPYIGSHEFVGRKAQLDSLNDWASPADSHPILLFEAIGGTGKSMLTWEWVTKHATNVREDWSGRFWYSFYERGAVMSDFCGHALAYITGQPFDDFKKKKTPELGDLLLKHLTAKPWIIVLDGLERVLVSYHRFDAAQLADEDAGKTDEIAQRDPCSSIRPEDDELLRALAGAAPSKLLLTSRLIPRVLLNSSSQPIPGVLRERLPGLRPPDAELLFRACGVTGNSKEIQQYLQQHCDCHPLVIGVLAGLISNYLPDRGNFDTWVADPNGGGQLNLADLDLVQKRNHILNASLAALDEKSRQILSTLALLSEAVDYPTLSALNPHLPLNENVNDGLESEAFSSQLQKTVSDLERRGLLQYDHPTKRYDLHPVVRGIAAGGLSKEERERHGQRVVDHFSQKAHNPYEEAEILEDLADGVHVVRALLHMDRQKQAFKNYDGALQRAMNFNLEAYSTVLSLLRPFFSQGWAVLPCGLGKLESAALGNNVGFALQNTGEFEGALAAYGSSLLSFSQQKNWRNVCAVLHNISQTLANQNRLAKQEIFLNLQFDLAAEHGGSDHLFHSRLDRFQKLALLGRWEEAQLMWNLLDPMGRNWSRSIYQSGNAEYAYAQFRFFKGDMTVEYLECAERLAQKDKNHFGIRRLHSLRGEWQLGQGHYAQALESFHEAVRITREIGQIDAESEVQLELSKIHLGQLLDAHHVAEQLAKARSPSHRPLAELWFAIGDPEQAKKHALAAYEWAWADGEPYVHRYELNQARALLEKLEVEIPKLPHYDPAQDEKFPWEDEVAAAIEKLRAENEAKKAAEESEKE